LPREKEAAKKSNITDIVWEIVIREIRDTVSEITRRKIRDTVA
jgi:hypothetical protein